MSGHAYPDHSLDILHVLSAFKKKGISISLKGDQLSVKIEKGREPDETILNEIRNRKDEIAFFLKGQREDVVADGMEGLGIAPAGLEYAGRVPLSYAQERLWIIDRLRGTRDYHLPGVLRWKGPLDAALLEGAIRAILERHHVLRTVIAEDQGVPYQYARDGNEWKMERRQDDPDADTLRRYIEEFAGRPFDLSSDFMLRAALLKAAEEEHLLVIVMHHIASDGLSMPLILREFIELYQAGYEGRPAKLPVMKIQYADYAIWQRRQMDGGNLAGKLVYWQKRLKGALPLELPLDLQRPAMLSIRGDTVEIGIGKELTRALKTLSKQEGVTLFMVLITAVKILLYRYSGQTDVCVGTPIANRTYRETEGLIGFFTNTLVLRSELDGKRDVSNLLGQVRATTLEAYDHMDAPFEKIVEFLVHTRDMSRSPLFQVMFVLNDGSPVPVIGLPAVQLSPEPIPNATAKFELTFDVSGSEDQLRLRIEYSTDLWTRDSIIRMAGHYKELLQSMVSRPEEPIALLNMLTGEERAAFLSPVQDGGTSDGPGKTLVELWEEQVVATPDKIALVGEHEEWSYRVLNKRMNQLANYLRARHRIKPNDLVGILLDRGEEMIISILAVLKAGGAYMPIDPEYPADRIGFMVSDSGCRLLLDKAELWAFNQEQQVYGEEDLIRTNQPGDLAYVIYTSGTTGRPKGVLIEHRNIVRLVRNDKFRRAFSASDVWTLFHSFCFDVSVWEMYGAFLYGGKLVLVTRETARDPESLVGLLQKERVTILSQTPSAFYNLIETVETKAVNGLAVRYVLFAGEALSPGRLRRWRLRYPGTRLINLYGITETTVHSTYKEIGEREIEADRSNIGGPLPGVTCYVMDPSGGLSPVGIPGELFVGGSGVGRGYLNREELTRERFIPHPFREGERLYRSGDRVRWLDKDEMEYLGRVDEQVKIRGYRIEPGEIDSVLRNYSGIGAAVTVARPGRMGEKELVAYVVRRPVASNQPGAETKMLNTADINNYLKARLPAYMVPAHYVLLEHLPLTANGKIDKKNLPDPEGLSLPTGERYEGPGNETEAKLVLIWQEILGKDRIGINDNFFDAGGNSIKLIRMVGMVNKAFDVTISVVSAFRLPNIRQLAEELRSGTANGEEGSVEDIKRSADIMQGTLNLLKNKVYGK